MVYLKNKHLQTLSLGRSMHRKEVPMATAAERGVDPRSVKAKPARPIASALREGNETAMRSLHAMSSLN